MSENEMIQNLETLKRLVTNETDRIREELITFDVRFSRIVKDMIRKIEAEQNKMMETLAAERKVI